ncbi:MAG TPA: MFS transporter [Alphaproteobacteria bacterium]
MDAALAAGSLRKDVRVVGLISSAHFFSHFYQLVLPPLFPLLKEEFGVSYAALGALTGLFFIASGCAQAPAGFLVDRFGARAVLLSGLALLSGCIALGGFAQTYWILIPIALAAGLGNSVFHPSDYAILNASIYPTRLGRAFGVHGIMGSIGWAAAPPTVIALAALLGWRSALVAVGVAGLAMTAFLATQRDAMADHRRPTGAGRPASRLTDDLRLFVAPPIVLIFAFFVLSSMALIGVQNFVPPALMEVQHLPLGLATSSLTAFLLATAVGTLFGGYLADHTRRRDVVLASGLLLSGVFLLAVAIDDLPAGLIMAALVASGIALGSVGPSRDMVIREAAAIGSAGKVYGFVYSGLDLGAAVAPPLFGWLMDSGAPRLIFVAVAAMMVLSIATVTQLRRAPPAAAAVPE